MLITTRPLPGLFLMKGMDGSSECQSTMANDAISRAYQLR